MKDFTTIIGKVKHDFEKFVKSAKYQGLTDERKRVIGEIFKTILASPGMYCVKSGRTLGKESETSENTALAARRWLVKEGILDLITLGNGKRKNLKWAVVPKDTLEEKRSFKTKGKEDTIEKKKFDYINSSDLGFMDIPNSMLENFGEFEFKCLEKSKGAKFTIYYKGQKKVNGKSSLMPNKSSTKVCPSAALGCPSQVHQNKPVAKVNRTREETRKLIHDAIHKADFSKPFHELNLFEQAYVLENNGFMTHGTYEKKSFTKMDNLTRGTMNRLERMYKIQFSRSCNSYYELYSAFNKEGIDRIRANVGIEDHKIRQSKWYKIERKYIKNFWNYRDSDQIKVFLKNDMVCIDIDYMNTQFMEVVKECIPECLVTTSPRGYHIFFHDPFKTMAGVSYLKEKIEVKHRRDNVIFCDEGGAYKIIYGEVGKIGNAPEGTLLSIFDTMGIGEEGLYNFVIWKTEEGQHFKIVGKNKETGEFIKNYDVGVVSNSNGKGFKLPERIPEGTSDEHIYRYARSLRAKGYTMEIIEECLNIVNETKCDCMLKKRKLKAILRYTESKKNNKDFIQKIKMFSKNYMPEEFESYEN